MSWFDEQIRQRKAEDDQVFREALLEAAGSVMGETMFTMDDRALTGGALERILRFYHLRYNEAPESIKTLEGQLEYILHPQGMMYREIRLKDGWQRDATGAFLGFLEESNTPVALIPTGFRGYRCYDPSSDQSWIVTKKSAARLKKEAYCFYRPFPQKKLDIPELFKYILGCMRPMDFLLVFAVTLMTTLVGKLVPKLTNMLYGSVLDHKSISVLMAMAVFMICVKVSQLTITTGSQLISSCVQMRLDLSIESAAMMRVLSMPPSFFREYSSGDLSSRMQSVSSLCSALVSAVLSSGLTSLVSLLYVTDIFRYTPALVVPSLAIIALTIGMSVLTLVLETSRQKKIMEQEAKTMGISFALVNGIQKIRLAGAEKRSFAHWANSYNRSAQLLYNPPMVLKINAVINEAIRLGGTIALYAIALGGAVTMKDYMAFNAAYGMVMGAFCP